MAAYHFAAVSEVIMIKSTMRFVAVICVAAMVSVSAAPVSWATEGVTPEPDATVTETTDATAPAEVTEPEVVSEPEATVEEEPATEPAEPAEVQMTAAAVDSPYLTDKSIYYLGDGLPSGLCLVSSNMFLLKRIAIMKDTPNWSKICLSEINNLGIRYKEYRYTRDGYTYHINKYKKFNVQTIEGVQAELIQLLSTRPEGVIIYGDKAQDNDLAAGKAADHGILIISYQNGVFYGIDPSHNRNGKSHGIEALSDTTIVTLKGVTHYMCIQDITYDPSAPDSTPTPVVSNAPSTLAISDCRYPVSLLKGDKFTITGNIKSNYKITNVTVNILDSKGKVKISKSASPGTTSYSLLKIDNSVKFGSLGTGKYTYQVTARDEKKSMTLVSKGFKVDPASTLKIKKASSPKDLKVGKSFKIKGTVKSNYKVKKVTVGIYTTSGQAVQTASKSMSKKSYNIKKLDKKIKFGKLEKGTYYYRVVANDARVSRTLINKAFTVK